MSQPKPLGGVIHTYQKFDPKNLPSPTQPPPDLVSPAFEHLLMYGSMRELTAEELARAVRLDPSQIAGLGPSLEALMEMLRERKRKILEKYETKRVEKTAEQNYRSLGEQIKPPRNLHNHRAGFSNPPLKRLFSAQFVSELFLFRHAPPVPSDSCTARRVGRLLARLGPAPPDP